VIKKLLLTYYNFRPSIQNQITKKLLISYKMTASARFRYYVKEKFDEYWWFALRYEDIKYYQTLDHAKQALRNECRKNCTRQKRIIKFDQTEYFRLLKLRDGLAYRIKEREIMENVAKCRRIACKTKYA